MWIQLAALVLTSSMNAALAQDSRDLEIFGGSEPAASPAEVAKPPIVDTAKSGGASKASANLNKRLVDTLQIGGRLEIRVDGNNREGVKAGGSEISKLKQADVYFDTRPNKNLRTFLKLRFSEGGSAAGAPAVSADGSAKTDVCTSACVRTDTDEMWLKWDIARRVYMTFGKQHVRWGSGRFWNPSDFTSVRVVDPLALFDRRLGVDMFRVHVPVERLGYNFYAAVLYGNARQVDQLTGALRGEFAFAGMGEAALSLQMAAHAPIRAAIDVSAGLGPVDVHTETVFTKRQSQTLYKGRLDAASGELPTPYRDVDKWFIQSLVGLDRTFKYSADDSVTFGAEFFYNQFGYDRRDLEMYSIVTGQSPGLYGGKRYVAGYMNLPNPGNWNDTNIFFNVLSNLADETGQLRLTASHKVYKEADVQAYVSRCFGDFGELCFRSTDELRALGASQAAPQQVQQAVQNLPTKRSLTTAGVGVVVKF